MKQFLSTHINRIDRKGRVSVPAPFRAVLGEEAGGILLFQSLTDPALDACAEAHLERLSTNMDAMGLTPAAHMALETAIYGAAQFVPFDGEGRIVLPDVLRDVSGIGEQVAFFGRRHMFQLWQPERLEQHIREERAAAKAQGLSLALLLSRPGRGPS